MSTISDANAIDIDIAGAFAAQANELLGAVLTDEQQATIDEATNSCDRDTLRKLIETTPSLEHLQSYQGWNTCIHRLSNALVTLVSDDATREVRSEILAKNSISYRLESDVYINDDDDANEINEGPDASVPVDNVNPLYDRVQHVQYAAGEPEPRRASLYYAWNPGTRIRISADARFAGKLRQLQGAGLRPGLSQAPDMGRA